MTLFSKFFTLCQLAEPQNRKLWFGGTQTFQVARFIAFPVEPRLNDAEVEAFQLAKMNELVVIVIDGKRKYLVTKHFDLLPSLCRLMRDWENLLPTSFLFPLEQCFSTFFEFAARQPRKESAAHLNVKNPHQNGEK